MKKIVIFLIIAVSIIIISVLINISNNRNKLNEIAKFNEQFEAFNDKTIYGADILTIINKAIDNNDTHNIEKSSNGEYIDDGKYTVKIDIILLTRDVENNIIEVKHPMEDLQKAGLEGFITNFSLTPFKYTKIEYNNLGQVSKIEVRQLEI